MTDFLLENEFAVRIGAFVGFFTAMAVWELLAPRRSLTASKRVRWANNISIVVLNTLVLRIMFPAAAVGVAIYAEQQHIGLLHAYTPDPLVALLITLIVFDFAIYLQHVMFHAVPLFWRLHRVHHADLDFDVTTGARFHPIEIILSMLIKYTVILLLGPPISGVIIFEIVLNLMSMFNHSNIILPLPIDRVMRAILVTPDMHRVHHSVIASETNSNFGFNMSLWDRLFGTYQDQPIEGHRDMRIGIDTFRDPKDCCRLDRMLLMPFFGTLGQYTVNRRSWKNSVEDDKQKG